MTHVLSSLNFLLLAVQLALSMLQEGAVLNDRPVVAILSQEYYGDFGDYEPGSHSYIAASYVKYIEGAGGRVLPILLDREVSYYEQVMNLANGLLIPGGGQNLNGTTAYEREGRLLISMAENLNEKGSFFPVWGTCLGFELIALHEAQQEILTSCHSHDQALPLEFIGNFDVMQKSQLYSSLSRQQFDILTTKNVTFNYHKKCITRDSWKNTRLNESYNILSVNSDHKGKQFISSFEHKKYPVYGVQFHPEKNIYEFVNQKARHTKIPHDREAIQVAQYFANFFLDKCRLNSNTWNASYSREYPLIYSFKPEHTIDYESFEQMYFFKRQ